MIVIASIITIGSVVLNAFLFLGGAIWGFSIGTQADIEIDSYRLCEDENGKDVIIVKYLLKNTGKENTSLIYEGDFYVYQNGVSLTECTNELPASCDYDMQDQYKNVKGGVEYGAEIAYYLESPDADVLVEVNDYGLLDDEKSRTFAFK